MALTRIIRIMTHVATIDITTVPTATRAAPRFRRLRIRQLTIVEISKYRGADILGGGRANFVYVPDVPGVSDSLREGTIISCAKSMQPFQLPRKSDASPSIRCSQWSQTAMVDIAPTNIAERFLRYKQAPSCSARAVRSRRESKGLGLIASGAGDR